MALDQPAPQVITLDVLERHASGYYIMTFCGLRAAVNPARTHVNLSNLAAAYNLLHHSGARSKQLIDWQRNKNTKEMLQELDVDCRRGLPATIMTRDGPNYFRGTYALFDLVTMFMAWLSPCYAIRMTRLMGQWELFKMTGQVSELEGFVNDFKERSTIFTTTIASHEATIISHQATISEQETALVIRNSKIANQEGLIEGQTRTIELFRGLAEKAVMTVAGAAKTTVNATASTTLVGDACHVGTMSSAGRDLTASLEALQRAMPVASTPGPHAAEAAEQVITALSDTVRSLTTAYAAQSARAPVIPPPAQETYIIVSRITGAETDLFYVTRGQRSGADRIRQQLDDCEIQIGGTGTSGGLEVRLVVFEGDYGSKQEYDVEKILEIRTSGANAVLQRLRRMASFKNHNHGNWCDIDPCAEITKLCENAEYRGIVD